MSSLYLQILEFDIANVYSKSLTCNSCATKRPNHNNEPSPGFEMTQFLYVIWVVKHEKVRCYITQMLSNL